MHIAGLVQKLAQNRRLVKLFFFFLKTSAFNFLFLSLSFILLEIFYFFILFVWFFPFYFITCKFIRDPFSLYTNASMSLCIEMPESINVFVCIDQISEIYFYIFFCLIGRIRLLYMKCFSNPIWAKFLICGLIKN